MISRISILNMTKSAALYWPSPCEPCIVKWQFILLEHLGNKDIQLAITGDSFVIVLCCGSTMHSWLCIQTLEQLSRRTSKNLLHARLSSSPTCRASFRARSRCERKCWCLANLLESNNLSCVYIILDDLTFDLTWTSS